MWYISFHGGSKGENNIISYTDKWQQIGPVLPATPPIQELRDFCFSGNQLFVVNAYKDYSQVLQYTAGAGGVFAFTRVYASPQNSAGIFHPYGITFDSSSNMYISSQDSNVVSNFPAAGKPGAVAAYLQQQFPKGNFLSGTTVASSVGTLPKVKGTPANVPAPQGLDVSQSGGKVQHSVRGVLWANGYLYVADEPGNAVKVYDSTGKLYGQLAGKHVSAPVQLILNNHILYAGCSGNDSVVMFDISKGAPSGTIEPSYFIKGECKKISGMSFDGKGDFYTADRTKQEILQFSSSGKYKGKAVKNLPDNPEFIMWVKG